MMADNTPAKRGRKSKEELAALAGGRHNCVRCTNFEPAHNQCLSGQNEIGEIPNPEKFGCMYWEEKTPATAGVEKTGIKGFQHLSENETPAGREFDESVADEMLGMVKMAEAFSAFASATALMKLQQVKEHGLYKKYGNWESYCKRLGKSCNAVDEQLQNLDSLGADAFDKLKAIGATRQDFRRLRKMEGDEQKLLVQEIEANVGDRDSLLELIEELGEKNKREKEALKDQLKNQEDALTAKIKRLENDAKADEKLQSEQTKKIKELHGKLAEFEEEKPTPDAQMQAQYETLQGIFKELQVGDDGVVALRLYLKQLDESSDAGMAFQIRELAASGIAALVTDLRMILNEFGLQDVEDLVAAMSGEQFDPTQEY